MPRKTPAPEPAPTLSRLSRLGPYRVSSGVLDPIGIPGQIWTPQTAPRFPAVVFGHGWLQPAARYSQTLRHLASWGFVVAAPDTERGPLPSHSGLAVDLSRTVDRICAAKLGGGRVTIDAQRVAAIGHGIGGSAAVLAAATLPKLKAIATISAAPTVPSAVDAAHRVRVPGLHLMGTKERLANRHGNGRALAKAWAGPVQFRTLSGATDLAFAEGKHWTSTVLGDGNATAVQRAVRALLTAFLLINLAGEDALAENFAGSLKGTELVDLSAPAKR